MNLITMPNKPYDTLVTKFSFFHKSSFNKKGSIVSSHERFFFVKYKCNQISSSLLSFLNMQSLCMSISSSWSNHLNAWNFFLPWDFGYPSLAWISYFYKKQGTNPFVPLCIQVIGSTWEHLHAKWLHGYTAQKGRRNLITFVFNNEK